MLGMFNLRGSIVPIVDLRLRLEIKDLIQGSGAKVRDVIMLVDQAGKVMQNIVARVKRVTDGVAAIAASCAEPASGIDQVNKTVTSMDEATQKKAALIEEATEAAQSLNQQAANLTRLMSKFRVGGADGSTAPQPASTIARTERRSGTRPWSNPKIKPRRATSPRCPRPSLPPEAAKHGKSFKEWTPS